MRVCAWQSPYTSSSLRSTPDLYSQRLLLDCSCSLLMCSLIADDRGLAAATKYCCTRGTAAEHDAVAWLVWLQFLLVAQKIAEPTGAVVYRQTSEEVLLAAHIFVVLRMFLALTSDAATAPKVNEELYSVILFLRTLSSQSGLSLSAWSKRLRRQRYSTPLKDTSAQAQSFLTDWS